MIPSTDSSYTPPPPPPPPPPSAAHRSLSATAKINKRRSRASSKPPVRILSADKSNFRDMVQKLTGFPCAASHRLPPISAAPPPSNLPHPFFSHHNYYQNLWNHQSLAQFPPKDSYHPQLQLLNNAISAAAEPSLPTIDTSSAYLNNNIAAAAASIHHRSNSTSSNDFSPIYDEIIVRSDNHRSKDLPLWSSAITAAAEHRSTYYGGLMAPSSANGSYDINEHLAAVDGILHDDDESFDQIHIIRSRAAELESLISGCDSQSESANYDSHCPSLIFDSSVENMLQQFPPAWLASDLLHTPTPKMIA